MNLWGFHKDLLPAMQAYFESFLRSLSEKELKAECLLPVMVGDFLQSNALSVKAEPSADKWFGITYAEDRAIVADALKRFRQNGIYPESLYSPR